MNEYENEQVSSMLNEMSCIEVCTELFSRGDFDFIVKGVDEDGNACEHKKQREALEILMSNKYEEFLYGGAAGGAKGLSINELVLTPFGFKEIGKLKVGSNICSTDGTIQRIIKRHDNGVIPFYKLTFADGTTIDCDYSHLWNGWKARKGRKINNKKVFGEEGIRKWTTDEIYETFKKTGKAIIIPLTEPVLFNVTGSLYGPGNFVRRDLDPYTLGVLLGDGCLRNNQVSFHTPESEISDRIKNKYTLGFSQKKGKAKGEGNYSFIGNDGSFVKEYLTTIKLMDKYSHEKFIPKIYLHGTIQERWDLLNGLMDTDGYADTDGDAFYSTSSKQLRDDIMYLGRSLGCFASFTTDENPYYRDIEGQKVFCKASYKVRFKSKTQYKLFSLKRKKDRVLNKEHQSYGNQIVNIEKIEPKQSICITVSNPNSLFITKNFLVTHNSVTGAVWILFMCLLFPGSRWFIARNELGALIDSVLVTFKMICRWYGFTDFKYNAQKNFIEFGNGSFINLIEIKYKPSDPLFEDIGSTEYTGGWIEEIGEIHPVGAKVLTTRAGRYRNKEFILNGEKLKGIVFYTCNPKRNWAKTEFYDKDLNGTLEKNKRYLKCLLVENPFIEKQYVEKMRRLADSNKSLYERLFKGNWDYEENPNALCLQEMIDMIFENDHNESGIKYITADIARLGSDLAVIMVWNGWTVIDMVTYEVSKTTEIQNAINVLRRKYRIPKNRCIADQDGVGGGVVDNCGIIGFYNGGKVIKEKTGSSKSKDNPSYRNLQIQCLYHLADRINEGTLWINMDLGAELKELIKEDLWQIQSKTTGDASKLDCKNKDDIRKDLKGGRSPDYRDALLMRVYFDLKKVKKRFVGSRPRTAI